MGVLHELPSEVLASLTSHLIVFDLQALLLAGCASLNSKLRHGGIRSAQSGPLRCGLYSSVFRTRLCSQAHHTCVPLQLVATPFLQSLLLRHVVCGVELFASLAEKTLPNLKHLSLVFPTSREAFEDCLWQKRIVMDKSFASLEDLRLCFSLGEDKTTERTNYFIGTLPRSLLRLDLTTDSRLAEGSIRDLNTYYRDNMEGIEDDCTTRSKLEISRVFAAFPAGLQVLFVTLAWSDSLVHHMPLEQIVAGKRYLEQQRAEGGVFSGERNPLVLAFIYPRSEALALKSLGMPSGDLMGLEVCGDVWSERLPRTLKKMSVKHESEHADSNGDAVYLHFPEQLEHLDIELEYPETVRANLFPKTLTHLEVYQGRIIWEEDASTSRLTHYYALEWPNARLPQLRVLEVMRHRSSVSGSRQARSHQWPCHLQELRAYSLVYDPHDPICVKQSTQKAMQKFDPPQVHPPDSDVNHSEISVDMDCESLNLLRELTTLDCRLPDDVSAQKLVLFPAHLTSLFIRAPAGFMSVTWTSILPETLTCLKVSDVQRLSENFAKFLPSKLEVLCIRALPGTIIRIHQEEKMPKMPDEEWTRDLCLAMPKTLFRLKLDLSLSLPLSGLLVTFPASLLSLSLPRTVFTLHALLNLNERLEKIRVDRVAISHLDQLAEVPLLAKRFPKMDLKDLVFEVPSIEADGIYKQESSHAAEESIKRSCLEAYKILRHCCIVTRSTKSSHRELERM